MGGRVRIWSKIRVAAGRILLELPSPCLLWSAHLFDKSALEVNEGVLNDAGL